MCAMRIVLPIIRAAFLTLPQFGTSNGVLNAAIDVHA